MKRKKHKRHRDLMNNIKIDEEGNFVELFGKVKIPVYKGDLPEDEVMTIIGGGTIDDEPLVPSELRSCAGTCGQDIWVSKTMLYKAIQHREYNVMCVFCCSQALKKQQGQDENGTGR